MTDAELARALNGVADSLEGRVAGFSAGLVRVAARRLVELSGSSPIEEAEGSRCIGGCGRPITQPWTGRRRKWCGRGECGPRKPRRTPENANV